MMSSSAQNQVRHVVAATDLSPASSLAIDQAALLAKQWGAKLTVLHVFNDGFWSSLKSIYAAEHWAERQPVLVVREHLSQLASQLAQRHGIEVQCDTQTGLAAREIALFGQAQEAQLLVIGEHGEDWLGDTVLGGTALKVLKRAELPVLLVRRPARPQFSNILVASDFSDHALRAAQLGCQWFPQAQKLLVHAYHVAFESRIRLAGASPDDIERYRINEASRAQQLIDEQVSQLDAGPSVGRLLSRGAPAAVLIAQAARLAADLIIIGKYGGSPLDERLLGSVTQNVLYQADCNVLLIP